MKKVIILMLIATLSLSCAAYAEDVVTDNVIEDIVVTYMTYFNKGNFEKATNLMSPESIKKTSSEFIKAYRAAVSNKSALEFQKEANIDKDISYFENLKDSDLVIYLLNRNRSAAISQSPAIADFMKKVVVKAKVLNKIDDQTYMVDMQMIDPVRGNVITGGPMTVIKTNNGWKVNN
jgi:hypothetical protein